MAHPKRRQSTTRRDKRRTHYKASIPQLAKCSTTGEYHSDVAEVKLKLKDIEISVKTPSAFPAPVVGSGASFVSAAPSTSTPEKVSTSSMSNDSSAIASNLITIKSPMIGTFYRRPTPEKPNFVEVGTEVSTGS
ncbi:unnamed protein product, partial [Notodromas monacha]